MNQKEGCFHCYLCLAPQLKGKRHLASGVLFGQEQGLLPGGHVGVDLGGGDGAVAQEGLDIADVHAVFQQGGGEGVPEHMGRHMERGLRRFHIFVDDPPHRLGLEGISPAVDEDGAAAVDLLGKGLKVPPDQGGQLRRGQLEHPLLASLALDQQPQTADVQMEGAGGQLAKLRHPGPRAE